MYTRISNRESSSESLDVRKGPELKELADTLEYCASHSDCRSPPGRESLVKEYFKATANFWHQLYESRDLYGIIHQERRAAVLLMVDSLSLPTGSLVLDIGCGAGAISVALGSRGFNVEAVDQVLEMINLTGQAAEEVGLKSKITATLGDIRNLSFPGGAFKLALVIGVLPWLSAYRGPLSEVARVLEPGGHVIVNVDNRWALHRLLDPELNFMLIPVKRRIGQILRRLHLRKAAPSAPTTMTSPREFKALLGECGFDVVGGTILGFGPFSVAGHRLFPSSFNLKCHTTLQRLCKRGVPFVRSMGSQYLVLARKR